MTKRLKLDSVADGIGGGMDGGMGSTTDLMGYQDEKPIMTFGIADYSSLGFREELGVGGVGGGQDWDSPLGVMSKFIPDEPTREGSDSSGAGDPSKVVDNGKLGIDASALLALLLHLLLYCTPSHPTLSCTELYHYGS